MYVILTLLIAVLIARCLVVVRRTINVAKTSSDTVIELACDADESDNYEREAFAPETLQYLYDQYSSDNQSLTEADRHVDKLYKMLESKSLDIESRLFLWREIWDIKIAALADATTR